MWETWSKISADQTFNVSYYHPDFSQTEDDGTSHISILSPDGSAVAVTTYVRPGRGGGEGGGGGGGGGCLMC